MHITHWQGHPHTLTCIHARDKGKQTLGPQGRGVTGQVCVLGDLSAQGSVCSWAAGGMAGQASSMAAAILCPHLSQCLGLVPLSPTLIMLQAINFRHLNRSLLPKYSCGSRPLYKGVPVKAGVRGTSVAAPDARKSRWMLSANSSLFWAAARAMMSNQTQQSCNASLIHQGRSSWFCLFLQQRLGLPSVDKFLLC